MSENSFLLKVFSPSGLIFEESVFSVTLPGVDGEVGVLPQHAKYVGNLGTGIMKFEPTVGSEEGRIVLSGGFARMNEDELHVIADDVILPDEAESMMIDGERRELLKVIEHGDANSPEWLVAKNRFLKIEAVIELRGSSA